MAFGSSRRRGATTPEYYKDMDGTTLLSDPSFLADLRDHYGKRGVYIDDNRDLIERFHRDQTFMSMNTVGGIAGLLSARSASKENRAQQMRLREAYQKLPLFFEQGGIGAGGAGNIGAALVFDPINLVGFGAGAGAVKGLQAVRGGATALQAAKAGAKAGAVRGAVAEGVVGAGTEAAMSVVQQNIDLELGLQQDFSVGQLALDAGAGGLMGAGLGAGFGAAGGAYTTVKKHRPARIAAMKNLGFEDDAIKTMSDDQITQRLIDGGRNPDEIDKAGAAMDAATQPEAPAVGEEASQPTATFGGVGGSRNPALEPDRSTYVSGGEAGQIGGLEPYTDRGPYVTIADVPDKVLEAEAEAVQAGQAEIEADKAADPSYAPSETEQDLASQRAAIEAEIERRAKAAKDAEVKPTSIFTDTDVTSLEDQIASASDPDLQGEVARLKREIEASAEGSTQQAVLIDLQTKIDAELTKRGVEPTAPEAQSSAPPQARAEAPQAPANARPLKVAAAAKTLAEKYEIDVDLVFGNVERKKGRSNDVTVDMVRQAYYARLREQAKADPKMVEAEGAAFTAATNIERAGGDPTDLTAFEREINAAIQDPDARRFAVELHKASLDWARQNGEVPAIAKPAPEKMSAVDKRRLRLAKKNYFERNPEGTDADAQAYAERSTFGIATKEDDAPSGVGETKGGSSMARTIQAAEQEANAGLTFSILTDKKTGERVYSPRISKLFRSGFDVGDGRTVSNKSMVPDANMFPAEEAMFRAQQNRTEGKSPVVPFTAGRRMFTEGGKELARGEKGLAYADGSENGMIFATRGDYEQYVFSSGGKLVSDVEDAAGPIKAQYANGELSAAEAAALLQQLDQDATAGVFNTLQTIPRKKGERVAALRAIKSEEAPLPKENVRILSEDQVNGELGVRGLIAQNGSFYGNPANWELTYVVRPNKGAKPRMVGEKKLSAKEAAFEEGAKATGSGNLTDFARRGKALGLSDSGPPDLSAIAGDKPNLTPDQFEVIFEIESALSAAGRNFGLTSDGNPTYGRLHKGLQALHSLPWANTLNQHRYHGELQRQAHELMAELFPRGVRLPEAERSSSMMALEKVWGQLDEKTRPMVRGLFENMQSGNAPVIDGRQGNPAYSIGDSNVSRLLFPNQDNLSDGRKLAAFTVTHEVMHWLYRHGMTSKERAYFWKSAEKFYGEDGKLNREKLSEYAPADLDTNGEQINGPSNALTSAQEYFANQGTIQYLRGNAAPEDAAFWRKLYHRAGQLLDFIFGDSKKVDDDLKPLFARMLGDADGTRYLLTSKSQPRTQLGVEIQGRFDEIGEIETRFNSAMMMGDEAGMIAAADDLLYYVNSVGMGKQSAYATAQKQGAEVRTTGVFSPLRDKATYNTVHLMRDQLYNVLRDTDANDLDGVPDNIDWAEFDGFQIENPDYTSSKVEELWFDAQTGLKRGIAIIKSRYSQDFAANEKKTLRGGWKRAGKSFLSSDAKRQLKAQQDRVAAREQRLMAGVARLENGEFVYEGMDEGFTPDGAKLDYVDRQGKQVSVTQSPYELMQIAFREGDTPTGRKIASLAARRIRATKLVLPDINPENIDASEAAEIQEMSVSELSQFAMDLMGEEPKDAFDFTDDTLILVVDTLKRRLGEVYFAVPEFVPDIGEVGTSYMDLLEGAPVVAGLQRAMDMRGPGAESMRTMFSRLVQLRGKGDVSPGNANMLLESDAATILGNSALGSREPLLDTSSAFRDLRSALRGATTRLLKGDDSAMADLAGMAARASMSDNQLSLLRQLGDDVGETIAKRLRGERIGLSEYPNRTELSDALKAGVERASYVVNGLISDEAMAKRYFRATLYGDMEGKSHLKPFNRFFPARGSVPAVVAADVAGEALDAGGSALARGVATFTRGSIGEGRMFYAGSSRGVENHTGGDFAAGPVGSAIYVSTSPSTVVSKPKGKPKNPELAQELAELEASLEESLPPINDKIEQGGPDAAVHRASRNRTLKGVMVNRAAQEDNGVTPSGVTPVVISARDIADLTPDTIHDTSSGLAPAIMTYLNKNRPQDALVFSSKVMGRAKVTGSKILAVLTDTIGEGRVGPMLRSMGYDGAKINRGNGEQIAIYKSEQVSALQNPALTTAELSPPDTTQPRIYDAMGDMVVGMAEGNMPDPSRIALRNELRVAEGMDPDLSTLVAEMEHGANGEMNPKKVVGIVRTYNRFMRGIADRMDYLGHKRIAERFRKFEFDQRREMGEYVAPLMEAINSVTGEKNILSRTWDYLNTSRRGRGRHRLAHNQSQAETNMLRALRMGTDSDEFRSLTDAEREVYNKVREAYRDVHTRMREAGIPIGDRGIDYFGQVWDQDHIRRNEAGFRAVLERLYDAEHGADVPASEQALAAYTNDKKTFAQGVIKSVVGDEGNGVIPTDQFESGAVINNIEHSRVLDFSKYPELHEQAMEYMDGSLVGNIVRYMDQATRKINHTNHFGLSGHAAFDYAKVAQEGQQGIVTLLTSNKVFTKTVPGVGDDGLSAKADVRYEVPAPFANDQLRPLANEVAAEVMQSVSAGDVAGARAKLMAYNPRTEMEIVQRGYERRVEAILDALQDHRGDAQGFAQQDLDALSANLMYAVRRGQGSNKLANDVGRQARRFNNITLLAFTTLTSMSDLAMPLLRTGDVKAFFRGWGAFMKAMRNEGDETKRALRRIGVGMDGVIASRLTEMTGDGIDVVQDVYFRGIGLTGWTNMNSEVSALIGFESFNAELVKAKNAYADGVELSAQSPKFKKAFRYLAHFGLDFRVDTEFSLDDAQVGNAVNQFVSETIFAPTPTQLPAWTNQGPWFKTVAQLKSFPMMYERLATNLIVTNGKGIREAFAAGDIKTLVEYLGPAGVFALAPLLGIGANSTKDIVMGRGGENDDEFGKVATRRLSEEPLFKGLLADQEAFDAFLGHYLAGMFTSGGLGLLAQMSYDAGAQLDNGAYGFQRVASLALGPSFGIGADAFNVASGVMAIPDPEGQARRRRAVRSVAARAPIVGQMRPVRESVVDTVAGSVEKKQSESYGVSSYGSSVSGYGKS